MNWRSIFVFFSVLLPASVTGSLASDSPAGRYILQTNDIDPTAPTSQPGGRWYHWIGVDPAVTHLETAVAIDGGNFAQRGQRITVRRPAPVVAVQVKIKRIGNPGRLQWQAGTTWGAADLGSGEVLADSISRYYERFVTLWLRPAQPKAVFLRLSADSGKCPDNYYAVYCTWRETHPKKAKVNAYDGPHEVGMMYRAIHADPNGEALDRDGRPMPEGPSMMTRLLTDQPDPQRRQILAGEEDPYTFVDALAAGEDPRRQGLPWPDLQAEKDDIRIGADWQIRVAAPRSPQVTTAVADLERFFRDAIKLPLKVVWEKSATTSARAITITEGKDAPGGPRRPAGYRFRAAEDRLHLHGYDPRGVLRAIWYLEDRLVLRGGPLVKPEDRVREPRFSPRATCSAWGGMGELAASAPVYTDAHLSLISHYGYDAIWLGWYPGPERGRELPTRIPPGVIPEGTTYRPFTARLRDLTQRAEKYDLEVVIQYCAPYSTTDAQRKTVQEEARQFFREVPKIRTIILLDEGMGSVKDGVKAWVDTCSLLASAFWDVRPDARVVAWRYSFRSHTPERSEWDKRMEEICRMDRRVGYMANFDSFWARRRDGLLQNAFDYCLSLKGPSDDYCHAVEYLQAEARRDGLPPRPLWTKIESRFSQESNTQPEIPAMQRWVERFEAVNRFQPPIVGMVANWYHQGFYPTPVTELFGWMSYTNSPPSEEILRAVARRDFGPGQENNVLAAWAAFSEAIWHYPFYYGLAYPMNAGLAQPFWLDPKAVNPRPWRRGYVNDLKTMHLDDSGEGPGGGRENRKRLAELQTLWNAGLTKLKEATAAAPPQVRTRAESQWRTARSFGDKTDMTFRLVRWLDARNKLAKAATAAEARAALDDLQHAGREELAAAKVALPMYLRDSRMGHLNHGRGCFTALTIEEKIRQLEKTLNEELPALRASVIQ